MAVYLIHLDTPLKHAQHYVGFSDNVDVRLERHRQGRGARFLRICNQREIHYQLVRVWPDGDRNAERRLHNCKNSRRYCPICSNHPAKTRTL